MRQSQTLAKAISWTSIGRILPPNPDLIVAVVLTAIRPEASEEELQDSADKLHTALCEPIGEDAAQIRAGAVYSEARARIQ